MQSIKIPFKQVDGEIETDKEKCGGAVWGTEKWLSEIPEGEIAERVLGLWYMGHCGWAQSTLAGCVGGGKWVLMILVAWTFVHDFVWSDD